MLMELSPSKTNRLYLLAFTTIIYPFRFTHGIGVKSDCLIGILLSVVAAWWNNDLGYDLVTPFLHKTKSQTNCPKIRNDTAPDQDCCRQDQSGNLLEAVLQPGRASF
ncbi:hypothetical protein CDD80_5322 [Ophiocordyceps camponoti-rufipedis]|uniref:Uncharacterized protein n=1 Tax=Ophiocordyceps camponoti-rufipedis TaxID=2004952 RepID=A0A2C5YMC0_9HYPO|nr:hypothetical protein CDD80_5322 [Ophiocordyceps camponoti-rufipedis]